MGRAAGTGAAGLRGRRKSAAASQTRRRDRLAGAEVVSPGSRILVEDADRQIVDRGRAFEAAVEPRSPRCPRNTGDQKARTADHQFRTEPAPAHQPGNRSAACLLQYCRRQERTVFRQRPQPAGFAGQARAGVQALRYRTTRLCADLHRETAARILGIALDDVTKEQRGDAKCIGFGGIYGMGGASLREYAFTQFDVDMTERQAKEALYSFFRPLPKLDRWRGDHADLCQRRGYIVIGAGRVVMAEWEPYGLSFQQCCNLPVQGACADVMLRALRLVHMRLLAARVRGGLVASVHDEIVLEVHEDDAELAKQILEESMVEAFTATFPGAAVNGLVKVNIGLNWGEAK